MDNLLVRLKPHDPRRGFVLRRFSYRGITFHPDRGWYRVESEVGGYLRTVRVVADDPHSPLAFDVCSAEEAEALDAAAMEAAVNRRSAGDGVRLTPARGDGAVKREEPTETAEADTQTPGWRGRRG